MAAPRPVRDSGKRHHHRPHYVNHRPVPGARRPGVASGRRARGRMIGVAMRIGSLLPDPTGPDALANAADDGMASAWATTIFGLDALTTLAVVGSQVPGIEVGTAVVPTYPRHPVVLAQQALTTALATDGRLALGIGLSHKLVI